MEMGIANVISVEILPFNTLKSSDTLFFSLFKIWLQFNSKIIQSWAFLFREGYWYIQVFRMVQFLYVEKNAFPLNFPIY